MVGRQTANETLFLSHNFCCSENSFFSCATIEPFLSRGSLASAYYSNFYFCYILKFFLNSLLLQLAKVVYSKRNIRVLSKIWREIRNIKQRPIERKKSFSHISILYHTLSYSFYFITS